MLLLDKKKNTGSEGEKKNTFSLWVPCAAQGRADDAGPEGWEFVPVLHASFLYPDTFWTLQDAAVTPAHQRGSLAGEKGRNRGE